MAAFIIVLLLMHCSWQFCDCCSTGETRHSMFFMSIDSLRNTIQPNNGKCICDNTSCSINQYGPDRLYWILSNEDVYGMTYNDTLGEMFNILRDDYLGSEYVASVYLDVSGQSFLGVGNPNSNAVTVDINLPQVNQNSLVKCENESVTLNLQPLEARTLIFNCDITGTHITGSDNIIVYVATFSLIGPNSASNLQFMIEQLIPINQWGTFYAVVPYGQNAYGDVISVVTSEPDTFVHILGYDFITVSNKYESIRRRIDGKRPITVRSSKPVGVTQFSLDMNGKNAMSICISVTTDTNSEALTNGSQFFHNYLRYGFSEIFTENNLPLSRFVANRQDYFSTTDIFGCSVYTEHTDYRPPTRFGGTFCGYLQNTANSSNRDWPRMDPGDGKDNDGDGSIDEDDCYSNFEPNAHVQDCRKEGGAGSTNEYFIIPVNSLEKTVTAVCCRSMSTSLNTIVCMNKSANTDTWEAVIDEANNVFHFEHVNVNNPLIIQSTSSSKLHLMCNYVCVLNNVDCSNSFYVPPVNMLGSRYIASVPPCPDGSSTCESKCSIAQVFNNTLFGYARNLAPTNIQLLNNEIVTESIKDGNFIESEYPIAVLCHSKIASNNNYNSYLVQFLLPLDIAGSTYNLLKTDYLVDEKLYVWATDSYTFVNFFEYDNISTLTNVSQHMLIQYAGDNIMIDLSSDENGTLYSITTNKPVNVIAHIKRNSSYQFDQSIPYNQHGYNIVPVPSSSNVDPPTDGTVTNETVSGITYHHISNYGWPHRSNFIKEERNKPVLNPNQEPGDGIDNDKDGLVDEEYCGFLSEENPVEWNTLHDIDLDGSYNEDCMGCGGGQKLEPMLFCTLCDLGTFRTNQSKIDKCIPCGENLTTFEYGSVSQDQCVAQCEEGMELNNGTLLCEPCQIGFYKNVSANDSTFDINERFWCLPCPDGLTTYDFGTIHNYECIDHCLEGMFWNGTGCQECPIGFYKETSSVNQSLSCDLRWNCTECDPGMTTYGMESVQCIALCTEGMELNNVSMECEPCELGYYKEVPANDTSFSVGERFWCLQCPSNRTTRDVGTKDSTGCVEDCPVGEELNSSTGKCYPCSVGFYKDVASTDLTYLMRKRWHCTPCPSNKTTTHVGTVEETDCRDHCIEGMFWNGTVCKECPIGFYKATSSVNQSLSYDLRWNCTKCDPGRTTYGIGNVQCIAHCGIGQHLKNGECVPCDIGFYKNTSSEDVWLTEIQRWNCSQCPTGLTTNSTGAHTCLPLCPLGKEYMYSSGKCEHCRVGFYKNISGSHIECFQCPVNFTTRQEGAVGFQDCKLANCQCPCDRVNEVKNYTSEELSKIIEEMKNQLSVNKAHLSATLRKKISVMDQRPSAKSIGYVGAILIALVFGLLLGFDIVILRQHIPMFFQNLRSLFC